MNREIKFRCWNGKEMVSPDYINRDGSAFWKENSIPTMSKEIMQYTGLKDRNGVEIYEGDVVKTVTTDFCWQSKGKVQYLPNSCSYAINVGKSNPNSDEDYYTFFHSQKEVEVIGNIHQNPELLK